MSLENPFPSIPTKEVEILKNFQLLETCLNQYYFEFNGNHCTGNNS